MIIKTITMRTTAAVRPITAKIIMIIKTRTIAAALRSTTRTAKQ